MPISWPAVQAEALDIFVRKGSTQVEELGAQLEMLKKIGLKRLKTYAIPAKYDQERQETFKKKNLSHG